MDWLLKETLPAIAKAGAFGKDRSFLKFQLDNELTAQDQYMSMVIFGVVETTDGSRFPVVIKMKVQDPERCKLKKMDLQFHNEITMYEKIVPYLLRYRCPTISYEHLLPQFFYGRNSFNEISNTDFIMIENVVPLGFRLTKERLFVDYDHAIVAIRAIAKFHGLSYTAKHKDPVSFREIVADIRDTQWDSEGQWIIPDNALRLLGKRGVDRLLERDGVKYRGHVQLQRFNDLIYDGDNSLRRSLRAREPFAVLNHGDFCRNNVLFRYDGNDRPVEALLFDLATPRYGSPALDLSFFLYMNTARSLREAHWNDVMDEYCTALSAAVPDGVRVPDRSELDAEMAASAFFGFAHVSFFLPFVLEMGKPQEEKNSSIAKENENNDVNDYLLMGGNSGTEYVADVVQHFVDMGYTNV